MSRLNEKVVIVTGASAGIGEAAVRLFRAEGAHVVMFARSADKLKALAEEAGPEALTVAGDLKSWDDVQRLAAAAQEKFGRIDVLVNNAGIGHYAPIADQPVEHFDEMVAVNLRGPFLCSKAVLPAMMAQKHGHIINVSSVAGLVVSAGAGGYCATKFGLEALTEALIMEGKPHRIKVSSVNPGSVKTTFSGKTLEPGDRQVKSYSLEAEDVARIIVDVAAQPPGVIVNQVVVRPLVPPDQQ